MSEARREGKERRQEKQDVRGEALTCSNQDLTGSGRKQRSPQCEELDLRNSSGRPELRYLKVNSLDKLSDDYSLVSR